MRCGSATSTRSSTGRPRRSCRAYTFGDLEAFDELFDEAPRAIVKVLVPAIYAAIGVVAEERGWTMTDALGIFCRSSERMATEAEAAQ